MTFASTSTSRTASRTSGTRNRSSSPAPATSSASQDGSGTSRATTPSSRSPSTTRQPTRSSAHHSSSSSAGATSRGTSRSRPRSAAAASRVSTPSRRTMGRSSVPARRTIGASRSPARTTTPSASSAPRAWCTWKEPSRPCGRPTRPPASQSSAGPATSVDDVDEHAAVLLDRRRLDDRAQSVRGPPAAADDLAVVVLPHGKLEDDRAVVLLELLDGHGVGLVDERPREVLEQLPHPQRPPLAGGGVDALGLQELADLGRRLGALGEPLADAVLLEDDRRGLRLRVVLAHGLDEAPVARRALVGHHDPPDRVLLAAHAGQSQSYCHEFLSSFKRRRRLAGLPHERPDVGHLPAADLAHQLAHLVELLDELVDLLDARARALRDPQPPRAFDELGPPALLGRHRQDDRLDAVDLALVDLHLRQLLARQPRQHPEDRLQRPHLAQRLELLEEVLERELVAA